MGTYKDKSDLFKLAAEESLSKTIYISVPHSAYYSCLMFMKHIWIEKLGNSEKNYASTISQLSNKTGSHEFIINQISNILSEYKITTARSFNNIINQLKDIRVDADYTTKSINIDKAKDAIDLMNQILPLLRKCA